MILIYVYAFYICFMMLLEVNLTVRGEGSKLCKWVSAANNYTLRPYISVGVLCIGGMYEAFERGYLPL